MPPFHPFQKEHNTHLLRQLVQVKQLTKDNISSRFSLRHRIVESFLPLLELENILLLA